MFMPFACYPEDQAAKTIASLKCMFSSILYCFRLSIVFGCFILLKYEYAWRIRVFPGEREASAELDCQLA